MVKMSVGAEREKRRRSHVYALTLTDLIFRIKRPMHRSTCAGCRQGVDYVLVVEEEGEKRDFVRRSLSR